jgi:hypothetical protein
LLTEHEISRSWRILFRESESNESTFARAEALLEELRPESPLRHRLAAELHELRRMRTQKPAPRKQLTRRGRLGSRQA